MQSARDILVSALRKNWFIYVLGVASLLLTSLTEVFTPKFSQWCIDLLSNDAAGKSVPQLFERGSSAETLIALVVGFSAMLMAAVVGRWGWRQTMARRTHDEGYNLKLRIWDSLRFQKASILQTYTLGEVMSRATADWNASRNIFGFTLVLTWDLIFFTSMSVGLMFSIDPKLAATTLIIWPFLPRFIMRLAALEKRQHLEAQECLASLSDLISQSLASTRLQKATASDRTWTARLEESAKIYADRRVEVLKTNWKILPLSALPTLFAYGVLFSMGIAHIRSGIITVGEFVAMCSYVLLLQGPLFELGNHLSEWQKGIASLERLAQVFNLTSVFRHGKGVISEGPRLAALESPQSIPLLEVRDLSWKWEKGSSPVLSSISLKLQPGQSVGIQGAVGSGKSTLLKLLSGIIEPHPRTVFLRDRDVCTIPHGEWARSISVVPQRAFLFAGTIRNNLQLGEDYSDSELWAALEVAALREEIERMPQKLESTLGEGGISLSGGQRQRLALARALLRPRQLLLLDDCLSAVDAHTEEVILSRMMRSLKQVGCIWIAHRMSTLRLCKSVFELRNGCLQLVRQSHGENGDTGGADDADDNLERGVAAPSMSDAVLAARGGK